MDIIKFNGFPSNPEFNLHEVTKLLLENGVDGYMITPSSDFFSYVYDIGETHNAKTLNKLLETSDIELPKQPFFSLFYRLDVSDFNAAYLYGPGFKEYLTMKTPRLENITNISRGLSQIVRIPLIAVYDGERWALPKFQVYENGTVTKESALAGKEPFNPDYGDKDEQKLMDNFRKAFDNYDSLDDVLDRFSRLFLE